MQSQQELIDERQELVVKIEALLLTIINRTAGQPECHYSSTQLSVMKLYSSLLQQRIAAFNKKESKATYCLEVGKTYVDAYGRPVKIVKQIGLRFVGDNNRLYSSNGQYRLDGRSPVDLVAEADHRKGGN